MAPDLPPDSPTALRATAFRLARSMFGPNLADDVAQEVMLRLLLWPGHLDGRDPRPLIATIVRTAGIDLLRRRGPVVPCETVPEPPVPDDDPVLDRIVARERIHEVAMGMRALSPRSRDLLLHVAHGGSLKEYAETHAEKPNAVAQRAFRIRRCLRRR